MHNSSTVGRTGVAWWTMRSLHMCTSFPTFHLCIDDVSLLVPGMQLMGSAAASQSTYLAVLFLLLWRDQMELMS